MSFRQKNPERNIRKSDKDTTSNEFRWDFFSTFFFSPKRKLSKDPLRFMLMIEHARLGAAEPQTRRRPRDRNVLPLA